jgi:hypothetical protein
MHPALVHLGRGLVVMGPLLTLGFGTFIFFGAYAIARRSAVLAWTAAGYFALIFLFVLTVGTGGESEDLATWRDAVGVTTWFLSGIVGTAHLAAVVHAPARTDRPGGAQATDTDR